ncbi:MAG: hypothetical protein HXX15_17600 [Rhodopseudomonas sp.]|uniref:hypothetical protein n=1 Tax=Rhodopseudomonas sp. TaxID=1078 RepID=UPI001798BBC1|nr:hypothetical protein [Rhodopseudomonas sp.]NVN87896.1 hypothetical protein [Rhodopseudomonas sp.]
MLGPALSQFLADLDQRKEKLTPVEQQLHDELARLDRMAPEFAKVLELHLDDKLGPVTLQLSQSDVEQALAQWKVAGALEPGKRGLAKSIEGGGGWPLPDILDIGGISTAIAGGGKYPDPRHGAETKIGGGGTYPDPKPPANEAD